MRKLKLNPILHIEHISEQRPESKSKQQDCSAFITPASSAGYYCFEHNSSFMQTLHSTFKSKEGEKSSVAYSGYNTLSKNNLLGRATGLQKAIRK